MGVAITFQSDQFTIHNLMFHFHIIHWSTFNLSRVTPNADGFGEVLRANPSGHKLPTQKKKKKNPCVN